MNDITGAGREGGLRPLTGSFLGGSDRCMVDRGFTEKLGIACLVAEIEGKVVGHLDVIPTSDRDLGRYLFLDVFMVHKSYRRKGVATALLNIAEELAVKLYLPRIIVMTEYAGAGGLTYRKNGYSAYREMYTAEFAIKDPEMPRYLTLSNPLDKPPLESHHMVCGWWNTPSKNWMDNFFPGEINQHLDWHQILLTCETASGKVHMGLKSGFPDRTEADICLWAPLGITPVDLSSVVEASKCIVEPWGAIKLTSIILQDDLELLEQAGFILMNRRDPLLSLDVTS